MAGGAPLTAVYHSAMVMPNSRLCKNVNGLAPSVIIINDNIGVFAGVSYLDHLTEYTFCEIIMNEPQ